MAESLFLNKKLVDIYPGQITRKIQIADVADIDARKSSFSYTLKLPRTSRNVAALDFLGTSGNTSRKQFEEVVADYVVDGVALVLDGFAVVRDTSKDYEVNLIDGIRSLAALLKGKKLIDLPLDDLSHILTTQEYVDSYSNTEGFIYGIADYGRGVAGSLKVEKQAPSIFTHTLFKRIFETAGLSLQGDFFTTNDKYLNEVVTPSRGYEVQSIYFVSTAKGGANTDTLSDYQTSSEFIKFNRKFTFSNNGLVGASIVGGNIVFSVAGTYKIDLNIIYSTFETKADIDFRVNNVTRAFISLPTGNSQTKQQSITFTVEVGDAVQLYLDGSSFFQDWQGTFFQVNYSVNVETSLFKQTGGQLIEAADYIGDMNQLDFLKDVINRYGLILNPVQNTNEYSFIRLEVLLNDRAGAEDWTDKLGSFTSESYKSGYAKINKATYQYPEAIVVPNNDGEMLIDNANAEDEGQLFSSSFQIPVTSGDVNAIGTYLIPVWVEEDSLPVNQETPLKVMHITRHDVSITAKLFDEVSGLTETENIPYLSLDFMSMQYFINQYYSAFRSLIEDYNETSLKLNLSVIDIYNLDFFRLKYLKQTQRFYYLVSVMNTTGKLSSVRMIEIQDFPENQPPSQIGDYEFDMNHDATKTITIDNLTAGYEDPEDNPPLKIKIISGFNADLVIRQGGVPIVAETEINVDVLDLTVFDALGGLAPYSEEWVFAIADTGSEQYGTETGIIKANVIELVNTPPVADAGADQEFFMPPPEFGPVITRFLNGSASYDLTGEIVSYVWSIASKPPASSPVLNNGSTSSPTAEIDIPSEPESGGTYVLLLMVTDEFGLSDGDTMELLIINYEE